MAKTRTRGSSAGDAYFDLVRAFPLRPIRSEAELDRAIEVVNKLTDKAKLSRDEDDYLDVLSDLIEKYEEEHHPMPPVSDADMLRFLIENRDITQSKVAEDTGIAISTISEILAGKRGLNRRHIELLSTYFHVEPSVFISGS